MASPFNRRQFLRGVGGAALMLPPLASLSPRSASAQVTGRVKRVILCPTLYGIDPGNFFPPTPALSAQTRVANAADTDVFLSPLAPMRAGLSTALGAAFDDPVLRSKLNIYEGLDTAYGGYTVHTYGALAGVARGISSTDVRTPVYGTSIDNTIAASPAFYASPPPIPVLRMMTNEPARYWSFDRSPTGAIQFKTFYQGDTNIFNRVFANVGVTAAPDPTPGYLVDKSLADLTGLRAHRRLSTRDRQLIDQYLTGVHELQKGIVTNQAPLCTKPNLSLQVTSTGQYWAFPGDYDGLTWGIRSCDALMDNYNQIILNAFLCDLTRVVVIGNELFQDTPISGYTQQSLFHSHDDGTGGPLTTAQKHAWFLTKLAKLAKLLDAVPDPLSSSGSLLDNSVILFTNEHGGVKSHAVLSIPTLTIGSAGGALKTGYYFDCRQRPYTKDAYHESLGRPNKQLLISIMQAMGVQRSEYINNGDGKGFGDFGADIQLYQGYQPYVNTHSEPLPGLKA